MPSSAYRWNGKAFLRIIRATALILLMSVVLYFHVFEFIAVTVNNAIWGINALTFKYRCKFKVDVIHREGWLQRSEGKREERMFRILYWTHDWRGMAWFGEGSSPFERCAYQNCALSSDKLDYNTSDAILFSMSFIHLDLEVPTHKFTNQKWIMHTFEPPPQDVRWNNFANFDGLFNATWTYHHSSELIHSFLPRLVARKKNTTTSNENHLQPIKNRSHNSQHKRNYQPGKYPPYNSITKKNYARGRTRLAAWFVTKCRHVLGKHSKRLQYVRTLEKYATIDVYGPCGRYHCGGTVHLSALRKVTSCDIMLKNNYKFYLAFENSICEDYVTEKLWRALEMEVVPVVMGGADYARLLPPHSYIDVSDFPSPRQLAAYLAKLDANDALYNEYFRWKSDYEFAPITVPDQCQLCEYLNRKWDKEEVYTNLGEYWSPEGMCTRPEVYYDGVDVNAWRYQTLGKTFAELL